MGMPNIVFRCQMFRGDWDQIWSQMRMLWMMEALCRVNQTHLRQFEEFRKRGLVERGYPSVYRSGLHYETEKGTEIWPDIPSLLMGTMGKGNYPGAWGDCLPLSTLVLLDDYTLEAIGNLVPGDRVMGDGGFTTVIEHAITGEKSILEIELDNGSVLRCSPEHRLFTNNDTEKRAEHIQVGNLLKTPTSEFPSATVAVNRQELAEHMYKGGGHASEMHLSSLMWSREQVQSLVAALAADVDTTSSKIQTYRTTSKILALQMRILHRMLGLSVHINHYNDPGAHPIYRITVQTSSDPHYPSSCCDSARVVAIRECAPELCCDITTDTGRFYLPESDVIVHNCEDLACYRVAELRELPYHFERVAPWDKTKTEVADPRYPQQENYEPAPATVSSGAEIPAWPGWKKIRGGIRSKPFAKWRRGPTGNYHYHALTYLPDGRLEDPSLVLGMGREAEFAAAGTAEKLRDGAPVVIQFARSPEVMVVDPEKPSGYGGGIAPKLDKQVLDLLAKRGDNLEGKVSGDAEMGAYLSNEILLGATEFDVDSVIGWSRDHKMFLPKDEDTELRRLLGYAEH